MPNIPYTAAENDYLRAHYATATPADIMAAVPGRAWHLIQNRASKLKATGRPKLTPLKDRTSWHTANMEILYALYPTGGSEAVAAATGLTANAVRSHAVRVGVRHLARGPIPYAPRKPRQEAAPKQAADAAPRAPRAVRLPMTPPRADTPVINARTAAKRRDRGGSTGLSEAIARHKKLKYGQPEHTAFLRDGLAGWQQWKAAQ